MTSIEEYLREKGVKYRTRGKNIGAGYISIQCPVCMDNNNHCGISVDRPFFSCWICEAKGHISKVIKEIEKCSWQKANKIAKHIYPDRVEDEEEIFVEKDESKFQLLISQFSNKFSKQHKNYLEDRNFDFDHLRMKYGLLSCSDFPMEYSHRIIAPVYYQQKIVNFIARDITTRATQKYLVCPDRISLLPKRKLLYNLDSVKKKIIIVEGITDVFRIGDGCVATLSTTWTREQVLEICNLDLKAAFVIYDSEEKAQKKAQKLCDCLSMLGNIDHVERVELEGVSDPGELTEHEVRFLRRELL